MNNPFITIYNWVETEILDFTAMTQALESLENLTFILEKKREEMKNIDIELQNINTNYSKIKLFFTFKSRETYQEQLLDERIKVEENINELDLLVKIATRKMESEMEDFEKEKLKAYKTNLDKFAELIRNNTSLVNDLWETISEDRNVIGEKTKEEEGETKQNEQSEELKK